MFRVDLSVVELCVRACLQWIHMDMLLIIEAALRVARTFGKFFSFLSYESVNPGINGL